LYSNTFDQSESAVALASVIADQLSLRPEDNALLHSVCLWHHLGIGLSPPDSMQLVLADIYGKEASATAPADPGT
jgi:hypothetical protein